MEKISVIVPVYNVESYLERCINSLLNQTYSNLEIILIDEGSTDRSGQICDQYKNRDEFVVIHKENAGLGMARNTGLDVATGKYIIFVDSDDYIDNNMIQSLYEEIQKTSSDTCIGGFKRVYANHSDVFKTELPKKEYIGQEVCTELLPNYLSAMDVFIMPSRFEGLPMSALEAQVNGLYTLVSNNISKETKCSSKFYSLNFNVKDWKQLIEKFDYKQDRKDLSYFLDVDKATSSNMSNCFKSIYLRRLE